MLDARATFRFFATFGASAFENGLARVSILCFPLVGLMLGAFLLVVIRLVGPYLHSEILAVVMVMLIISATRGRPMNGIYETLNALTITSTAGDGVRRQQVYGVLVVLLVVLLKIKSIEVVGENRGLSLLLSPLLARWSVVLFLFGSSTVAEEFDLRIGEKVRSWHLIVATAGALGFAAYVAGAETLWVALCLSVFALLARGYLHHREGGVSSANCGALIELSEALAFTLFASL